MGVLTARGGSTSVARGGDTLRGSVVGNYWNVTLEANNVGGAAKTDWPVRVDLGPTSLPWARTTTDGRDLSIRALDGVTKLPFWIEKWDNVSQTARLWIRFPSISAGGTASVLLYYGFDVVGDAQQPESVFSFVDTMDNPSTLASNLSSPDGAFLVNKSRYPNPVVAKVASTFKDVLREPSNVIYRSDYPTVAERYVAAYTGDNGAQAIGIVFSPNGLNWTDYGQVIPNAEDPYFVRKIDGSLWTDSQGRSYCYFERKDGTNTLGLARSANFKSFEVWSSGSWTSTVANHTALLSPTPSSWEDAGLGSPCVIHDGTTFQMLYEGWTNTPSYVDQTGIMRSTDGVNFTRSAANPIITTAGVDVVDDVQLIDGVWWGTWHATGGSQYRLKCMVTDPNNWIAGSWTVDGLAPIDVGNSIHPYPNNCPLFGMAMFMPMQVGADTLDMFDFGGNATWQLISLGAGSFHSNPYHAYIDGAGGKVSMKGVDGGSTTMRTRGTPLPSSGFSIMWFGRQTGAEQTVAFGSAGLHEATPFPAIRRGLSWQDDGGVWKIRVYGDGGYEGDVVTGTRDVDMTVDRRCELRYRSAGQVEFLVDGVQKLSGTNATYAAGVKRLMATQATNAGTRTLEFLAVRKYDGVDPIVTVGPAPVVGVWLKNVGQATQSNQAMPVVRQSSTIVPLAGPVVQTNTAQPITPKKTRAVAQAAATDSVTPITDCKSRSAGQSVETELSRPVTGNHSRIVPAGGPLAETQTAQLITRRQSKILGQVVEADLSQIVARTKRKAVVQSLETDLSQLVTKAKRRSSNQAIETDLSQAASKAKRKYPLQSSETSTAFLVARSKRRTPTQSIETDLGAVVARRKVRSVLQGLETDLATRALLPLLVRQAIETDISQALSTSTLRVLLQIVESDTAQAHRRLKSRVAGQISEADLAQSPLRLKRRTTDQAVEPDTSQPLKKVKTRLLGQVVESGASQPVLRAKKKGLGASQESDTALRVARARSIGLVVETDLSGAVTEHKVKVLAQPAETDTNTPVTERKMRLVGLSAETDATFMVAEVKRKALGQVSEFSSSQTVVRRKVRGLQVTTDTSSANPVAHSKKRVLLISVESDTAQSVLRGGYGLVLGQSGETDTAFSIIRAPFMLVGKIVESNTPLQVRAVKRVVVGQVVETSTARALTRNRSRTVQAATETDTATDVVQVQGYELDQTSETDVASTMLRRKSKVLAQAVENDDASSFSANVNIEIDQTFETEVVRSIVPRKSRTVGTISEGSVALQVGRVKTKNLAQTTESGATSSVATRKIRLLGLSSEINSTFSLGLGRGLRIGQAVEQDRAWVVVWPEAIPVIDIPSMPAGATSLASESVGFIRVNSDPAGTVANASGP